MTDQLHDYLKARQEADKLIAELSGHMPKLVDALSQISQKKTERRLVPFTFAAPNGARTDIIGGIAAARIGLSSLLVIGGAAAAAFSLDQGRGSNWGPLIGLPGSSSIGLAINQLITITGGDLESPLLIADVGNTISVNNTGAQTIIGAGVYITLETGP